MVEKFVESLLFESDDCNFFGKNEIILELVFVEISVEIFKFDEGVNLDLNCVILVLKCLFLIIKDGDLSF